MLRLGCFAQAAANEFAAAQSEKAKWQTAIDEVTYYTTPSVREMHQHFAARARSKL